MRLSSPKAHLLLGLGRLQHRAGVVAAGYSLSTRAPLLPWLRMILRARAQAPETKLPSTPAAIICYKAILKWGFMNPFKPTAGKMPPELIGHDAIVEAFVDGMGNGPARCRL